MMSGNIKTIEGIQPHWPAPPNVRAFSSYRYPGSSVPPYDAFNLGEHVGDQLQAVVNNRDLLKKALELPREPGWLKQVHGKRAVEVSTIVGATEADASYTKLAGMVCAVMTADCLPVLLCDRNGKQVAAVHAGWRGLAAGVIEATIHAMGCRANELLAWLGPAIGPDAFEVGDEVRQLFINHSDQAVEAFKPVLQSSSGEHWLADIYQLARQRLNNLGVTGVYGGQWCTYHDSEHFFSYRRDGITGRTASLIWLAGSTQVKTI